MKEELWWLSATLAATAVFPFAYVLNRIAVCGVGGTIANPSPTTDDSLSPWAKRAKRAHANAVENLAVFAPAVLLLVQVGAADSRSAFACAVYFFSRLLHFLAYTLGIVGLRTALFCIGWGATMFLIARVLGWA